MDDLTSASADVESLLPSDDELRRWIDARLQDGRARVTNARAYSSAVFRCDEGPVPLAVKVPIGGAWQRRLLRRERRAYRKLEGLAGFPCCFKLLDNRYLILEWIDGTPFRFAEFSNREVFFNRLRAILDSMHERGIAHGDLKKKENLLVVDGDRPVVLDLGTAVRRGEGLGRLLFSWLRRIDNNAWLKLKYGPELTWITPEDARYHQPTLPERIGRRLRRRVADEDRELPRPTLSSDGGSLEPERSDRFGRRRTSPSDGSQSDNR